MVIVIVEYVIVLILVDNSTLLPESEHIDSDLFFIVYIYIFINIVY